MKKSVIKLSKRGDNTDKKSAKNARSQVKSAERKSLEQDAFVWLRDGSEPDTSLKRKIARIPDEPLGKLVSQMNRLTAKTLQLNEQIAANKAKANQLRHEIELIKERKESARLTDEWILKVEDGALDEPFPFYFARESLDKLASELIAEDIGRFPADDLEMAARDARVPVKLWETALMTVGSPRSASKLIELAQRVLMILSLRSGFGPIARENDVSGAGALLAKFYAELLPGIRELSENREKLASEPKHLLGKLYRGSRQFRQAFEAELIEHKRVGWAADAARAILMNIDRWRFSLTGLPPVRPYPIPKDGLTWVEDECERILSPNPYPLAPFQLSPWEKVWSKEWWIHIDVVRPDNGDSFRKEWRALWTEALKDAFARYREPKTEVEFKQAWDALYAPLARTIPPPKETRAERQTPGGRISSVKTALCTRLGLAKR